MLYEARLETADTYAILKDRLQDQGFTEIPSAANPMLDFGSGPPPKANTSECKVKTTMIRKKKE